MQILCVQFYKKQLQLLGDFVPKTPYRGSIPGNRWGLPSPDTQSSFMSPSNPVRSTTSCRNELTAGKSNWFLITFFWPLNKTTSYRCATCIGCNSTRLTKMTNKIILISISRDCFTIHTTDTTRCTLQSQSLPGTLSDNLQCPLSILPCLLHLLRCPLLLFKDRVEFTYNFTSTYRKSVHNARIIKCISSK